MLYPENGNDGKQHDFWRDAAVAVWLTEEQYPAFSSHGVRACHDISTVNIVACRPRSCLLQELQ